MLVDDRQSATSVGAKLLGIDDRLGTLEAGKIADVIAVQGDPQKDIVAMQRVVFVMKEGVMQYRLEIIANTENATEGEKPTPAPPCPIFDRLPSGGCATLPKN